MEDDVKKSKNKFSGFAILKLLLALVMIAGVVVGCVFYIKALTKNYYEEPILRVELTENIVNLKVDSANTITGLFVLAAGSISGQSEARYYYYTETEKGYIRHYVAVKDTYLEEVEDNFRLEVIFEIQGEYGTKREFGSYYYKLYIPQGTIETKFSLD